MLKGNEMKKVLVGLVLVGMLTLVGCQGGTWGVQGSSNYETSSFGALFSPDPNGGIGPRVITDSKIADSSDENVAAGLQIEFLIGDVAADLADRVIPGEWLPLEGSPAKLYGTMSFLFETKDEDFLFMPGVKTYITAHPNVRPFIAFEYMYPGGSTDNLEEGDLTTFGIEWRFQ